MKFKIKLVGRDVLHDYLGANYFFAKQVSFPWHWSKNTILIRDILKGKERKKVIKHEIDEITKMKRGKNYWPAHIYALGKEKK